MYSFCRWEVTITAIAVSQIQEANEIMSDNDVYYRVRASYSTSALQQPILTPHVTPPSK